ncbi:MAG TPA: MauE/DoxX family redox-associated membrane protein [Planktothrix sp.]|jgi:uncharacterized membrane protein
MAQSSKADPLRTASAIACGCLFITAGIFHFAKPQPFIKIVPEYIPFPEAAVYVSGVAEIAGGVGMMTSRWRRKASYGLILLLLAVFPANINMAVNKIDFGSIPHSFLWLRLPLQLILILWVRWSGTNNQRNYS